MSANNAIFVIPIEWTHPSVISGGKVERWTTHKRWLVFHGDMDRTSELAYANFSPNTVTKELLWYAFTCGATMHDSRDTAMKVAAHLEAMQEVLEYGEQVTDVLRYEEPWN